MAKRAGAFKSDKRRKEIDRLKKQQEKRSKRQTAAKAVEQPATPAVEEVVETVAVQATQAPQIVEVRKASTGDKVKVHYTGKFDDGTVFDSSIGKETLDFKVGSSQIIKGFSNAVTGMVVGETRTVSIPYIDAYGEHRKDLVMRVPRKDFPATIEPVLGMALNVRHPSGGMIDVRISEITEDAIILDANHPLAGKDLTFEMQLVEIA